MRLRFIILFFPFIFANCSTTNNPDETAKVPKKGWARFFPFLNKEEEQAPVKETPQTVKKNVVQKTAEVAPLPPTTPSDQDYALSQQLRSPDLLKELSGSAPVQNSNAAPAIPQVSAASVVIKAEEPQIPAMPTATTPTPPEDADVKKLPTKQ